jgi:hypothetical protein
VVETNTIKDLNVRLSILDEDVNALRDKKGLFSGGNHKKAMRLKEAQAPERDKINAEIRRVQGNIQKLKQSHQNNINQINERIAKLKKEHADEIAKAQANIEKMRGSVSTNKDDLETGIVTAENNIVNAQNSIDDLIIERQPLEATILKLETEVGPIKYIAALAVDWGIASEVNLSKAVRWVIIIIIFVFDPTSVSSFNIVAQSGCRSIIKSSILFCALTILSSAVTIPVSRSSLLVDTEPRIFSMFACAFAISSACSFLSLAILSFI